MTRYLRVLMRCAEEPWAIERSKLSIITQFLLMKASGQDATQERIAELEAARVTRQQEADAARTPGSVGVIPVYGTILQRADMFDEISGGVSAQSLAVTFRSMMQDDRVKAIIMDFDSPGGMVSGTPELADEIYNSRGTGKPIIAQVNSLMASAAYWIGAQCDEIVVTQSGRAGSIGVYTVHEDISRYLEAEGVKPTMIASSKEKIEGNPYEPLGAEARAHLQKSIDYSADQFTRAVARGRGVTLSKVREDFGNGRMYDPNELVSRGMADKIASLDETLERFGVVTNPIASRQRAAQARRSAALETMVASLKAGGQPGRREMENAAKESFGFSNREAELFVNSIMPREAARGDREEENTPQPVQEDPAMQQALDRLRLSAVRLPRLI